MANWLIVSTSGSCWISDGAPLPNVAHETVIPFSTWSDANTAKGLYYGYRGKYDSNTTDGASGKLKALQTVAEEYGYNADIVGEIEHADMFTCRLHNVAGHSLSFTQVVDAIVLQDRSADLFDEYHPDSIKINEQTAVIGEKIRENATIRTTLQREEARSAWLETILRYVMYKIALATIVYGTHRERTLEMLSLVRDINFKMSIWSMEKSDMDDIPF